MFLWTLSVLLMVVVGVIVVVVGGMAVGVVVVGNGHGGHEVCDGGGCLCGCGDLVGAGGDAVGGGSSGSFKKRNGRKRKCSNNIKNAFRKKIFQPIMVSGLGRFE